MRFPADSAVLYFCNPLARATISQLAHIHVGQRSNCCSTSAADANKVVIVAINKSTGARTAAVKVTANHAYARSKVFTITAAGGPSAGWR